MATYTGRSNYMSVLQKREAEKGLQSPTLANGCLPPLCYEIFPNQTSHLSYYRHLRYILCGHVPQANKYCVRLIFHHNFPINKTCANIQTFLEYYETSISPTLVLIQFSIKYTDFSAEVRCSLLTVVMSVFNMYLILRSTLQFHKLSFGSLEMLPAYYFHGVAPASQKVDVSYGRRTDGWIMLDPAGWEGLSTTVLFRVDL